MLFIVMAGVELLLPIYAQNVREMMLRESGLLLLPGALLMGVSGVISGKIYDNFGGRYLIRIGFLWIAVVLSFLTMVLTARASYFLLMGIYAMLMTGVGFMMTPITALAMASLPSSMMNYASSMTTTIHTLGMSMGGALLITLMTITADYSSVSFSVNMLKGFQASFWALTVIAAGGFFLSFFVPYNQGSAQPLVSESRQAS
nr:MFS transporter [Fontibacillus phaseoli]